MFGFNDKPVRIKQSSKNSIKEYVIVYPVKKGATVKIGKSMLCNITKISTVIVHMDTNMTLMGKQQKMDFMSCLKNLLKALNINFSQRIIPGGSSNGESVLRMIFSGKKDSEREIVTFQLEKGFFNEELFSMISLQGCEIYIPNNYYDGIVDDVFNFNFEDAQKRYDTFEYVLFISDLIGQAALRTKKLDLKHVEDIVK